MKGYFTMQTKSGEAVKVPFEGVAFGGNYGGHNVNVNISDEERSLLSRDVEDSNAEQIEDLLSEIQRRLLNNEMIVDYDKIKPEEHENLDGLGLPWAFFPKK